MKTNLLQIVIFWVSLLCCTVQAQHVPVKSEVIATMKLVNDYWIDTHSDPGHRGWDRAVYFTGNQSFYAVYPHHEYLNYSYLWSQKHNWEIDNGVNSTNADQQCAGQVYIDLFRLDAESDTNKIEDIKGSLDNMIRFGNTNAWWWIDALYMAMPSFVRLGVTLEDESYFEHMYELYSDTKEERGLYNEVEGLWYRDEAFKPPYATPNGEDSYWSRGNGWVFGAHVKVLQELPEDHENRGEYLQTFQAMAAALAQRQRADGFWNVSLDDPDDYGGPETSGTAFFTYGMAWGINNGILDSAEYAPLVFKAWQALTDSAVHADGFLGFVQGVGVGPASSQPVTYWSTTDFGVGAFLLAGSELAKMVPGAVPDTPQFWVERVELQGDSVLQVIFNKQVGYASAQALENYEISEGVQIAFALVGEDLRVVILSIPDLQPGAYRISISSVKSANGEGMDGVESEVFKYSDVKIDSFSSYEWGSSNVPENTLDFDLSTRWSAEGEGEFLVFDLGEMRMLESTSMAFYNGNRRQTFFDISISDNGQDFEKIYDGESSGNTLDLELFDFPDHQGRYLKYTGYGNSQSAWNSLTEVRFSHMPLIRDLDDATLRELSFNNTPLSGFQALQLSYEVELSSETTEVPLLSATTNSSSATVEIENTTTLPGKSIVTVTAENGTDQVIYEVFFSLAKSTEASLSDLKVNGTSLDEFSESVFDYEVWLDAGTTEVPEVNASLSSSKASVSIVEADGLPGTTKVIVIAEDGHTQSTYNVAFMLLKSTDAFLSQLIIDDEALETFIPDSLEYEIALAFGSDIPHVGAVPRHEDATFEITQAQELPGTAIVHVLAEDQETDRTYMIHFSLTPLALAETEQQMSVAIYPNPAKEVVYMKSGLEISNIELYDMGGRLKQRHTYPGKNMVRLDLRGLSPGLYLLRISGGYWFGTQRLLIE